MARETKKQAPPKQGIRWKRWLGSFAALAILSVLGVVALQARDHVLSDPAYSLSRGDKEAS